MNAPKLKGKIVECGTTQENVAHMIGIDRSTFYRKMKYDQFYVNEAKSIKEVLGLTDYEAVEIFFDEEVAKTLQ